MKVLVYRWDIFPYDDIINELKNADFMLIGADMLFLLKAILKMRLLKKN